VLYCIEAQCWYIVWGEFGKSFGERFGEKRESNKMKLNKRAGSMVTTSLLGALLWIFTLSLPAAAQATTYRLDPAHSTVSFKVRHLMMSWVRGSFTDVGATFDYDEEKPEAFNLSVTLDAASINTGNKKRDAHLRDEDFLDVKKFPLILFTAKEIRLRSNGTGKMIGELMLHGVTKGVTLTLEDFTPEMTDPWGKQRRGASATLIINRTDYGILFNKAMETGGMVVGDEVIIQIDAEFIAEPPPDPEASGE
jgi:polyisoprenoid-binding protein YceI